VADKAERCLRELHHYRLARDLGQLAPAVAVIRPDATEWLLRNGAVHGGLMGGRKVEALSRLRERGGRVVRP